MSRLTFDKVELLSLTISPVSVTNADTTEQTFTVKGLRVSDVVLAIIKPTQQNGLICGQGRVTAKDTLGITFANFSASPITPTASEAYLIYIVRPDRAALASSVGGNAFN